MRTRSPGVHGPSPMHAPVASHTHAAVHRDARVPHAPQGSLPIVPGAQIPSPAHAPYAHVPPAVQKRSTVPHDPQATFSTAPGVVHGSGGPASKGRGASARAASLGGMRPPSMPSGGAGSPPPHPAPSAPKIIALTTTIALAPKLSVSIRVS